MGILGKLTVITVAIFAVFVGTAVHKFLAVPPVPHLEDVWWGKGAPREDDKSIKPFKINIPQQTLDDLKQRLKNHRPFVPPLEGIQQQYGINTRLLNEIVEFWKDKYNWREREQFLNKFPQFKTQIHGLDIHFIHVKPTVSSKNVRVLPLLLLHGWPGSVREFYDIIPLLTTPQDGRDFVFEVIVPSLPGYGFSDAPTKPGFGPTYMAQTFKNLMLRLGYEKFYIQGGDWGALIVSIMGTLYPEHILGVHSNMCLVLTSTYAALKLVLGSLYPSLIVDKEHEDLVYPVSKLFTENLLESGYMHIQATKPDTVGVALNDSPVGLAAYVIEKFTPWTNKSWKERDDGGLKEKFTYTDLLDNVMIYWVTGSITTSMRLYSENFNKAQLALQLDDIPIEVPTACAKFRNELLYFPDSILKLKYRNLVHSVDYDDGGHFAAFEVPEILAKDIWIGVQKFENLRKNQARNK